MPSSSLFLVRVVTEDEIEVKVGVQYLPGRTGGWSELTKIMLISNFN